MGTTWSVKRVKKHNLNDYYAVLTLTDERGERSFKIDNLRHFIEDCDNVANYKGL